MADMSATAPISPVFRIAGARYVGLAVRRALRAAGMVPAGEQDLAIWLARQADTKTNRRLRRAVGAGVLVRAGLG